jgi:hypothetical protein
MLHYLLPLAQLEDVVTLERNKQRLRLDLSPPTPTLPRMRQRKRSQIYYKITSFLGNFLKRLFCP